MGHPKHLAAPLHNLRLPPRPRLSPQHFPGPPSRSNRNIHAETAASQREQDVGGAADRRVRAQMVL